MGNQQFVLVVYDISNDRRRTRLHDTLLDYGTPVQYSIFECLLDEKGLARMKRAVGRVIRPRVDHVRFYYLCAGCVRKTEVTGGGVEVSGEEPEAIVV
jgi:CRISPR-associated protein Cas2